MSIAATFGAGGAEPYATALRANRPIVMMLHGTDGDGGRALPMDVKRWNAHADAADLSLLRSATGPLLDIGCGPGRMVRAAMDMGLDVLGVDVSPTAIDIARAEGLSVIERSVFDRLPAEGQWQTVLLVDGNVGIGGDVRAMLVRCLELLAPSGEIVVELHPDPATHSSYSARVIGENGGHSEVFPWAEIGLEPLVGIAAELGLVARQSWEVDGRAFCRLVTTR